MLPRVMRVSYVPHYIVENPWRPLRDGGFRYDPGWVDRTPPYWEAVGEWGPYKASGVLSRVYVWAELTALVAVVRYRLWGAL